MQLTAENWQQLSPLVDEALSLAPSMRLAWLAQQTQLTEELHAQLSLLLAASHAPETADWLPPLPELLGSSSSAPSFARVAHQVIGPYTLIRELGTGGMAEVWLARRSDGAYEREVALKLPHAAGTRAVERLLRERNVLASLEHPGIARFYDAGLAADGQPYLAMEHIEGEPLRDYAAKHRLSFDARCDLIAQVLGALHYAHQRLVVHRDLKPGNIIVRPDGKAVLLDFGIATVLDAHDKPGIDSELTIEAGRPLTPAYAAPEQLLGEPITTSSDVFAVGVLLFELLNGQRPFHAAEQSPVALVKAIETTSVTTHLSAPTEAQPTEFGFESRGTWARAYDGDLSAICCRALRSRASDRYASALAFQEDLERYASKLPVQARDGAWTYRCTKFIQRNRAVLAAASVASILTIGLGVHAWRQTVATELATARSGAVEGVMRSLFQGMGPGAGAPSSFSAKELLDRSVPLIQSLAAADGDLKHKSNVLIASLYLDIGNFDEAYKLLEIELSDARTQKDVARQVWAYCLISDGLQDQGQYAEAAQTNARAQQLITDGGRIPDVLSAELDLRVGATAVGLDKLAEAETSLLRARERLTKLNDQPAETTARVLLSLGQLAARRGDLKQANAHYTELQKHLRDPKVGQLTRWAGELEFVSLAYAERRFRETVEAAEAMLMRTREAADAKSMWVIRPQFFSVMSSLRVGRWDIAEKHLSALKKNLNPDTMHFLRQVRAPEALIALYKGQTQTAVDLHETLLLDSKQFTQDLDTERFRRGLGQALLQQGRTSEALPHLKLAEKNILKIIGSEKHPEVALTRVLIGCGYLRQQEWQLADTTLLNAYSHLLEMRGEGHYGTLLAAAYREFLPTASQNNQGARLELSNRIERDLAWQYGAAELIKRLRSSNAIVDDKLPAIL